MDWGTGICGWKSGLWEVCWCGGDLCTGDAFNVLAGSLVVDGADRITPSEAPPDLSRCMASTLCEGAARVRQAHDKLRVNRVHQGWRVNLVQQDS